ncbi:MAG: 30S ribosomal protein S8 [Deltaproteobacteria bacterium]|nr:30S ribosomal protein S8 [Deltaproteobacteria bacterium]MCB9787355.1 30S ribosomal protein S8 [Deltaproteobacteria bacterium]
MSMTDPIADLLTRIRNAQLARHESLRVPASKIKQQIVEILKEEGFVADFRRAQKRPQDELEIDLKYGPDRRGAIIGIRRESTPGRRVYVGADAIPRVRHGLGVAIISTSQGVLADHAARKKHVGGELLLTVW